MIKTLTLKRYFFMNRKRIERPKKPRFEQIVVVALCLLALNVSAPGQIPDPKKRPTSGPNVQKSKKALIEERKKQEKELKSLPKDHSREQSSLDAEQKKLERQRTQLDEAFAKLRQQKIKAQNQGPSRTFLNSERQRINKRIVRIKKEINKLLEKKP